MCTPDAGPRERELYRKWQENNPDTPFPIGPLHPEYKKKNNLQKRKDNNKKTTTDRSIKSGGLFAPMTNPAYNMGVIEPLTEKTRGKKSLLGG